MIEWEQLIQRILPSHVSAAKKKAARRSRRRQRVSEPPLIVFAVRPEYRCFCAYVNDLSANNLGFLSDRLLKPGLTLALLLCGDSPSSGQTRLAAVRHVTQSGDSWVIRCELQAPFSQAELQALKN